MTRFVVRRAAAAVLLLFVLAAVIFLLQQVAPGDPAQAYVGGNASPSRRGRPPGCVWG